MSYCFQIFNGIFFISFCHFLRKNGI
jgi:hypothetical protein